MDTQVRSGVGSQQAIAGAAAPRERIDRRLAQAGQLIGDAGAEVHLLDAPELAAVIPEISKLIARCEALKLNAVRCADRLNVGDLVGARSTWDWLADATGVKPGTARKDIDVAARLDELPVVEEALADGTISPAQAGVLAQASGASEEEQEDLLESATTGSVKELEDTVKEFRLRKQLPTGEIVKGVTITRSAANVTAAVVLDPLGGEVFELAVDTAAGLTGAEPGTPWSERRAEGLVAISRFFLERHENPSARLGRPHVLCDVPWSTLATGVGTATLGSGTVIDADTARQLCCDAGISRLVSGPAGEPVDIGRTARSIPAGLAKFLLADDRHCRWPGCTAPAWGCEGHHVIWWGSPHDGETSPDNVALLCWHHHHLIHDAPRFRLELEPGTRRLSLFQFDRFVASSDPPGRRRREPAGAPAPPPTDPGHTAGADDARPDPGCCEQPALFSVAS